jgi:hypothetical protein
MTRLVALTLLAAALLAAPAAARSVDLGPGATPDVAVGADGAAHVVLQVGRQGPLTVDYCQIPRGATACAIRTQLPLAPALGRPRIVRRADGMLIVAAARNVTAGWETYVLTSADNGASWSAPALVGNAFYDIDAIELTPDGLALDTLHVGSTTGQSLQRVPLAGVPETRSVPLESRKWASLATLAQVGGATVYVRDNTNGGPLLQRTFAGGDLYAPAAWTGGRRGTRGESAPDTAVGPRGAWLVTKHSRIPRRILLRRLRPGGLGPSRTVSAPVGVRQLRLSQDGRGRLHVTWLAGDEHGSVCQGGAACIVNVRGTWKRIRGKRRLVFSRAKVLVRVRSNTKAPDGGLETAAGPAGGAAAVYRTNGGRVRYVPLAR